jgi:predicted DNA-binding transcriptional regulator AlpA
VTPCPLGAVAMSVEPRWLSKKQLRAMTGLAPSTIDRLEKAGLFPKRFRVGFRVFWDYYLVVEWMLKQMKKAA